METVAVQSFGGIFKFVVSKSPKDSFLKGRILIAENRFPEAAEEFVKAKRLCDTAEDTNTVNLILEEIERYLKHQIPPSLKRMESVDWNEVRFRKLDRLDENLDRVPQGLFTLNINMAYGTPLILLGRKTLSDLWLQNLIPEIFCSQVRPDMFLGLFEDFRVTDSKVIVYFHAITPAEKLAVFDDIIKAGGERTDLAFPFPLIKTATRKEFTSPSEGWDVDTSFDHALSSGEEHIRQVTVDILKQFGFTSHRLYDPACSTGVFLNSLKKAYPDCTTIGQDLSMKMCEVAKSRVDEVHCGSAIEPMIEPESAHCVFIRFLNSEVVTSTEAEMLLQALLPTVVVGGIIITFGHTPVLLSSSNFICLDGFELIRSIAVAKDKSTIFQYYIIKRLY